MVGFIGEAEGQCFEGWVYEGKERERRWRRGETWVWNVKVEVVVVEVVVCEGGCGWSSKLAWWKKCSGS